MSGIAAVFNLNSDFVDLPSLYGMMKSLRHRGSDDQGVWFRRNVGLVHMTRWTTPESLAEKLPCANSHNNLFLTCDARIDNRDDLLREIRFDRRDHAGISDAELILAAYEKWGEDCPAHLIGDFVFALWDAREHKLFAARDPLGVKHFYYYYEPQRIFALASEIKALTDHPAIPRELNEEHLGDYLVLNSEDKESTFFRNIRRLPSTHALTVSDRGLKIRRYWSPKPAELRLRNDREYRDAFREKFTEAVTCRLRSAYPVGSMLSGGLDSSSIVCVGSEHLRKTGDEPMQTFSAVFPTIAAEDPRIDESGYMHSVIAKSGCQPNFVNVDGASPLKDIDRMVWHADHPVGAPNVYMDWELYRAAQSRGVRVLLSGTDGDSTVGHGYEDFVKFARRGWYVRLMRESLALSRNMPRRTHTFKRNFWHRGVAKAMPPSAFRVWRKLRQRPEPPPESPIMFPLNFAAVREEFRNAYRLEERIASHRKSTYPEGVSPAEHHWNALTSGHFSMMLEQLEKAAAAFGVEPRYPFFDRRLVEFCISLPPGQRINNGWTRSIFRYSMEGILPEDVQWRKDKSNIGASVKINLLKHGSDMLDEAIEGDHGVLDAFVDTDRLRAAYRAYREDPMGREAEALVILTNVYLKTWLEQNGFAPGSKKPVAAARAATAA